MRKILLVLLLLPSPLFAASTIDCHCFQDRVFNPQAVSAADPYFLATAQNSFLARVYQVDKKSLVKAKMAGADSAALWISYDLATRSGTDVRQVDGLYQLSQDWRFVVSQLRLDPEQLGADYLASLGQPERLAALIVDRQLTNHLRLKSRQIRNARSAGMTSQEIILAAIAGADPLTLAQQRQQQQRSWGQILFAVGITDGDSLNKRLSTYF